VSNELRWGIAIGWLVSACVAPGIANAGEVRLKNGIVVTGNLWQADELSKPPIPYGQALAVKDVDPICRNIVLIDNGWQKFFVPRQQIAAAGVNLNLVSSRPEGFEFKHLKTNQTRAIASAGSFVGVSPFDEFGVRKIFLTSQPEQLKVVQAIRRIEPDHVELEGLNYNWRVGLSLKAIPQETLKALLRRKVRTDEAGDRLQLVRFYMQAELYPQAFEELDTIERDFPDQQSLAESLRSQLMDYFGHEVLRELNRRKGAGQHLLANEYAQKLSAQNVSGSVMDDIRKLLADNDRIRKSIDQAKNMLVEWQNKLKERQLLLDVQPIRGEINEQLNIDTLPRLQAFLQSETDREMSAEQRLALAYSGWLVGAENAITDLQLAIRYWEARFLILEFLRADSPQERDRLLQDLKQVEGVGPKAILQIIALLPTIREDGGILPGQIHRVLIGPMGQNPHVAYSVVLPPEYSPLHSYPLLIVLRSQSRTNEMTLRWWCGDDESPGPAMRRGYIVIAPELAKEDETEYKSSDAAHQVMMACLRDARLRFNVDSNRVFLAGQGMGADAAFDLGMSHPDEFAGVIPIGGKLTHYQKLATSNGRHTAWYVVGRGFTPDDPKTPSPVAQRDTASDGVFNAMFDAGFHFDFILVECLGLGLERDHTDMPGMFHWIDLQRRKPIPAAFEVQSVRKTDNRFFWVTAADQPRTPESQPTPADRLTISASFVKGLGEFDVLKVSSRTKNHIIRFLPALIDFDRRVIVNVNNHQKYKGFMTPDVSSMLNELRITGDRTRLPWATVEY